MKLANAVGEVLDDLVCLTLPVRGSGVSTTPRIVLSIRKGPHDYQEAGLRGP